MMHKTVKFSFSFLGTANDPSIREIFSRSGFDYFVEATQKAEGLGFEGVFFADHIMPEHRFSYDAWTALTALALKTKSIRLGSCVTPIPFYHPGVLAKRIASLDRLSGGRVIFGAGCGWFEKEFKAFGVPFDRFGVRFQKMMEGIEIIKALWTNEDPVSYSGKHYTIDEAEVFPKPLLKPHPPIWFGGESSRVLKATAEYGQGWIPGGTRTPPGIFKAKSAQLQALLQRLGRSVRDVEYAIAVRTLPVRSETELKQHVKNLSLTVEEREKIIYGTPKDCIVKINKYIDAGVTHFVIGIQPADKVIDGLSLYSEQIIPYI